MPQTKTYTGGCHRGMVRFECTTDLARNVCNCSICTKKGLHFAFLPPKSFQLRAGEDNLKEYLFNKHAIRHQLCNDCGVDVFAHGTKPDGTEVIALNVSCIDGIQLEKLAMHRSMDGTGRISPSCPGIRGGALRRGGRLGERAPVRRTWLRGALKRATLTRADASTATAGPFAPLP